MSEPTDLPMPAHYDPLQCEQADYVPDPGALQEEALAWARSHDIEPAGSDARRSHLLVIDDQIDFSFPSGALFVGGRSGRGAMDAQRALVEFVYRNLGRIAEITCTLDSHVPFQIFFPAAHLTGGGVHPPPNTPVSADDYKQGRLRPNPAMAWQLGVDAEWLERQFVYYCEQLEAEGKYQLFLWPYHCLLGSEGHRLSGVVDQVRLFHGFARQAANRPVLKGDNPLSERYSVFREEVATCFDGRPIPGLQGSGALVETLLQSDALLLAGLASSHCLKESITDLLVEIRKRNPAMVDRIYILRDCSAAVVIPDGPDFTEQAEKALDEFAAAGMHVVDSTTPMAAWPGMVA
ncbi:MAG: nicotinamidase [Deltaproteobacteria bacterium]|nr:nicotinamidase [Deltaproteobacteria bacterium]